MWNEVKKDEKEGHCSGCKRCVLCRNAYDHRLRLGRCRGSSHKHLEHSQIADSVGGEQCCFPCLDVILAVLLFVKIGAMYMDYRKHGQIEWTPVAVIFACLIFTLTAPLYIWSIV